MKKGFLIIGLLAVSALQAQKKEEEAIRRLLQQQTESWNSGNLNGFMQTYWEHDSLMFIGKNGITQGWKNTLDHYKRSYPGKEAMGELSFDIIQIKMLSKGYFFVTGRWRLQRKDDTPSGYYTLLIRKIKDAWKIIADHSS
jgi:uncharacterized protein (TIGR02246 family)